MIKEWEAWWIKLVELNLCETLPLSIKPIELQPAKALRGCLGMRLVQQTRDLAIVRGIDLFGAPIGNILGNREFTYFAAAFVAALATTGPAVIWGGCGSKGAICCFTKSAARRLDSSSASLVAKTLTETITASPSSTQ